MVEWLIQYHEGWHGPKARWTKKHRDDFDSKAGFLMLFIDGFKFTKENVPDQATEGATRRSDEAGKQSTAK